MRPRRRNAPARFSWRRRRRTTPNSAYEGLTTHAAIAAGRAGTRGRITPGSEADFTIFAENPLTLTPERQAVNPVIVTVVDGRVQHTIATKAL
ncbi:amidohydrolase family protein [Nonomuraea sp. NPDC059194]|uniref:amidohydrolase family protein n=1 Tax=Nonomuraea sp. NPDC059194 TaxID=3346764 RepID=UPI0036A07DF9